MLALWFFVSMSAFSIPNKCFSFQVPLLQGAWLLIVKSTPLVTPQ